MLLDSYCISYAGLKWCSKLLNTYVRFGSMWILDHKSRDIEVKLCKILTPEGTRIEPKGDLKSLTLIAWISQVIYIVSDIHVYVYQFGVKEHDLEVHETQYMLVKLTL